MERRGYSNGDFDSYYQRRRSPDIPRPSGRGEYNDDNIFRTVRITNLNPRVSDREVEDAVYHEFRKFGEFNVKVTYYGEKRIAFVNFRHADDASAALNEFYNRLVMFDIPVRLGPVYPRPPPRGQGQFVDYRAELPLRRSFSPIPRQHIDNEIPRREFMAREDRSDRQGSSFALHQRHLPPEEDSYACRTLFVGNVDPDISADELKAVFSRYGFVEDIDIKKPAPSSGSPYAFIRFFNLDMAYAAKVKLSGKFIGPYQCKIGYGKPAPSSCVWVGGLGPWVTKRKVAKEFDRFGDVIRIVWPEGQPFAYISYDNVESAKQAVAKMRGFRFKEAEAKLRLDFVDPKAMDSELNRKRYTRLQSLSPVGRRSYSGSPVSQSRSRGRANRSVSSNSSNSSAGHRDYRKSEPAVLKRKRRDSSNGGNHSSTDRNDAKVMKKRRTRLPSSASDISGHSRNLSHDNNSFDGQQHFFDNHGGARTVSDLVKSSSVAWSGLLTLKNSAFHVQMHLVCGSPNLVRTLMCDSTNGKLTCLKLTQRLRLEPSKLEEVQRRIQLAKDEWSILVGVPGSGNAEGLTASMQERSLKNLVTYFRQKDAAGVLSLPPNSAHGHETGLLHAFSPCTFAHSYLLQNAPQLDLDTLAEDYIVVILVRVNL